MRELFRKLDYRVGDIICGVKNVIRWLPVIWRDRWWDWSFLADIIEYKLRHDEEKYRKYGTTRESKSTAKEWCDVPCFALRKPIKIIYMETKTFKGVMEKYESSLP